MIRVSVLYPKTSNSHFDMDYYLSKHIPLVRERLKDMGLARVEVDEGLGSISPNEQAPFAAIGHMIFETMEDLQRGLAAHAQELMGDIPNFTDVRPQMQVSRIVIAG